MRCSCLAPVDQIVPPIRSITLVAVNTLKSTEIQLKAEPIQDERDTTSAAPAILSAASAGAPHTCASPPHAARSEAVDDQKAVRLD